MKIPNAEQIKACDQFTIKNEPIGAVELMERAAAACVKYLAENFPPTAHFYIFCGPGNNGGDGFAIARLLYQKSFEVDVFYDAEASGFSTEASQNFERLKAYSGIDLKDYDEIEPTRFSADSVIVDALFGSGLNRQLTNRPARLIEALNTLPFPKISIDIPSGLFVDKIGGGAVFQADVTLSFQFWKRCFLHPETGEFCGLVKILDIGLQGTSEIDTPFHVIDIDKVRSLYRPREAFSHKGSYGKSVLVAGSPGKMGAAVLATAAAVKTGSGLTYTLAPSSGCNILQSSCPEAMFLAGGNDYLTDIDPAKDARVGIGPGLGTHPDTQKALLRWIENLRSPAVFDADALNILAENSDALKKLPENAILTPHPKEFERLFGPTENSFQRSDRAVEVSKTFKVTIVLKDRFTQVVLPDGRVFYNTAGNPGMAKGGSGDVLTGMLTALLAQKYTPKEAALLGVWLHSTAADVAVQSSCAESLLPTDIIGSIPAAFRLL